MLSCLSCMNAELPQNDVSNVYCNYRQRLQPVRTSPKKGQCPCGNFRFIAQGGESVFDLVIRLARRADYLSALMTRMALRFPGRSAIIDMWKHIEERHQMSLEIDEEEAQQYIRVLEAARSPEETAVFAYSLLLALDRGLLACIQDYWNCIGEQDGILNSENTRHLGYLLPKKAHDPTAPGPKGVDSLDKLSATARLASFLYVPPSARGYRVTLSRVDDCCWEQLAKEADLDLAFGLSQAKLITPTVLEEQAPNEQHGFVIAGSGDGNLQLSLLKDHLARLVESGGKVLVFPELTVPQDCLVPLANASAEAWATGRLPVLAVLGSFHRQTGEGVRNTASVYGVVGNEAKASFGLIAEVHKNEPFEFPDRELSEPYKNLRGALEAIVSFRTVHLLDTPVGRICVLICKDAITGPSQQHLDQLRPEIVLVPAMSESIQRFLKYAEHIAVMYGTTMVVANSAQWAKPGSEVNSFVTNPEIRNFVHFVSPDESTKVHKIRSRYRVKPLRPPRL